MRFFGSCVASHTHSSSTVHVSYTQSTAVISIDSELADLWLLWLARGPLGELGESVRELEGERHEGERHESSDVMSKASLSSRSAFSESLRRRRR